MMGRDFTGFLSEDGRLLIQFNSIRVYLRADLTAQRPITKLARVYGSTQKSLKNKIQNMTAYI
jgi:hypothetical protein